MEARCILAFAGHMIDRPTRTPKRFPAYAEEVVKTKIRDAITQLTPIIGVCSAACGGDIIFAEEILKQDIPLYIILPFEDREDFIGRSVAYAGKIWVNRFNEVCERAKAIYFVKPGSYSDDKDFENNQYAVIFFALGIEAITEKQLVCLVLYDGTQLGDSIGGTLSFLRLCRGLEIPLMRINMLSIRNTLRPDQESEVNIIVKVRFTAVLESSFENILARQHSFVSELAMILDIDPRQIHIRNIVSGCVRLTIEIVTSDDIADRLLALLSSENQRLSLLKVDRVLWSTIRTIDSDLDGAHDYVGETVSISPALSRILHNTLFDCGPFFTESALRSVFTDARVKPWQDYIPETDNPKERVECIVSSLCDQFNTEHQNALVLFLRVIADRRDPVDSCHQCLSNLANELEQHTR